MIRYGNAHNRDFAKEHYQFFVGLQAHYPQLKGKRVLDVGCGKSMWLTLLLHSAGARVTGIDTEAVEPKRSIAKYYSIAQKNGLERAIRTLVWDVVYARPYYQELAVACPFPLRFEDVDARSVEVAELPFPVNTFDLVVSHEVFEHISDISSTLRALHRVMKPDGIAYIYIHNYASLSGGHHIAWKYPDTEPSTVVPPWDHLRDHRYPDIPSWINRMREHEYRDTFEKEFEILDWIHICTEGSALLTPQIREELRDYSEQELLTKGFVVVARPKGMN